jgi:hypothetical protein
MINMWCSKCQNTGRAIHVGDSYCSCYIGELARQEAKAGYGMKPPRKPPTAIGLIDPEPEEEENPLNGRKNPEPRTDPSRRIYDRRWRPGGRG